jgi:hypothetical protein
MTHRLTAGLLIAGIMFSRVVPASAGPAVNVAWAGQTGVSLRSGADTVVVVVTTCELKEDSCIEWQVWTDSLALRANIVSDITITVNGVRLWVPRSTWTDALMPVRIRLTETGIHTFRLVLDGGDGDYADREEILFTSKRVTARRVRDPESNKIVEQTSYY